MAYYIYHEQGELYEKCIISELYEKCILSNLYKTTDGSIQTKCTGETRNEHGFNCIGNVKEHRAMIGGNLIEWYMWGQGRFMVGSHISFSHRLFQNQIEMRNITETILWSIGCVRKAFKHHSTTGA